VRSVGSEQAFAIRPICALPPGFFVENGKYEFSITLDGMPLSSDVDVLINEVPAEQLTRRGAAFIPFEVGFYAGDLRLCIVKGQRVLAAVNLEVDPDIAKLTRDEYAALISEIARSTLALYRLGGMTVPAEIDPSAVRSDLVTLDLIRTNIQAFERAVAKIADQPARRLHAEAVQVDVHRAKHIGDRAISQALRSGKSRAATIAETRAAHRLVGALGGGWIPNIAEVRRAENTDVYENRALLGFLRWLDGTLAMIARRISEGGTAMNGAVAAVWVERIGYWRSRVSVLARRDIFRGLTADPSLRATSVFRMHPDYASAFSSMVRMRAGLGTGSAVAPAIPLDRTFSLYEIWCYIGLLHAAAEAFPICREGVSGLLAGLQQPNRLGIVLANGETSSIDLGQGLTLTYQRRFSTKGDPSGCHTNVIEAIPDVTIARVNSEGRCTGIVVLDPKYRGGASLLDGVRDLHVYRDATSSRLLRVRHIERGESTERGRRQARPSSKRLQHSSRRCGSRA
jgi:hypothetical protein